MSPLLIQLGVSLIGEHFAQMDEQRQMQLLQQQFQGMALPQIEKLAPEVLGPTALSQVSTDPRLRDAQYGALNQLQQEAKSGGMTLEDRATYDQALGRAAKAGSRARGSIRENLDARGGGTSGDETALQLNAAQNESQQAGEAGVETAADSRRRALDAMMGAGRLGGEMRGQEYGEKSAAAKAQDLINEFNAKSRMGANAYNASIPQQQFENSMGLAGAKAGVNRQVAGVYGQRAQGDRRLATGLGVAGRRALENKTGTQQQPAAGTDEFGNATAPSAPSAADDWQPDEEDPYA